MGTTEPRNFWTTTWQLFVGKVGGCLYLKLLQAALLQITKLIGIIVALMYFLWDCNSNLHYIHHISCFVVIHVPSTLRRLVSRTVNIPMRTCWPWSWMFPWWRLLSWRRVRSWPGSPLWWTFWPQMFTVSFFSWWTSRTRLGLLPWSIQIKI